jgi:hypothetical protein
VCLLQLMNVQQEVKAMPKLQELLQEIRQG